MRWGLLCGVGFVGALACQGGSFFVCNGDDDCGGEGSEGVCQPTGACSFPDDECDSGQRYGESSPASLAGECVDLGPGSGGPTSDTESSEGTTSVAGDSTEGMATCPPDWWDCAWSYRQRLELDRPVTGPLSDVPLLVLLADGRVDHDLMQADGEDVRFVSAGGVVAPYEIERWDPQGVSTLWVTVDELGGAADHLWLYYGNPVAENAEDPDAVWPGPFAGVWHLEDDPIDSSGNDNVGTPAGTTEVVTGQLANGRAFDNSSARIDVEASPSLADVFGGGGTVSAWIRPDGWGAGSYGRIAHKAAGSAGWYFYLSSGGRLVFAFEYGGSDANSWRTLEEAIVLDRWSHVAASFDPAGLLSPRLFVDGVEQELEDPAEVPEVERIPTDVEVALVLGNRPNTDRRFDGVLDEIRVEATARSPEWIGVQHDAMRDALLRYGPLESWGPPP